MVWRSHSNQGEPPMGAHAGFTHAPSYQETPLTPVSSPARPAMPSTHRAPFQSSIIQRADAHAARINEDREIITLIRRIEQRCDRLHEALDHLIAMNCPPTQDVNEV